METLEVQKVEILESFAKPKIDTSKAREIVEGLFPSLWFCVEASLSAISTLLINDIKDPASLILVGSPSSDKGTALNAFKDHPLTYWSDKFTPASFVSQAANKTEEELKKVDLLPRIKDKALIVPELGPIFSARIDVLKENIATLTRIFDGEGYFTDAGTGGHRGYGGEYRFTFLGATTPPSDGLWRVLGKLGNRLCFLNMPEDLDAGPNEFAKIIREDPVYKDKLKTLRASVCGLLDQLIALKPVEWNRFNDPEDVVEQIGKLAELSGKLRGDIPKIRCGNGSYERGFTQVERPMRFSTLLYNLARGRALLNGRMNIDDTDLDLVREVALSSCPEGRYRLMKFLIARGGEAETKDVEELLGCSKAVALEIMEDLETLGVVSSFNATPPGRRIKKDD